MLSFRYLQPTADQEAGFHFDKYKNKSYFAFGELLNNTDTIFISLAFEYILKLNAAFNSI
jgi:hypothetical protein